MRYLFINGSFRKGNTWKLAEKVRLDLLRLDRGAEIKEIHLSELQLPLCIGCSNCFRLGREKCPHYEKVSSVVNAIADADGVIVASTTYNMRETALLKNLFDHLCFMLHRPYFFKSRALVLTTTGGVGAKAAAKSIVSMLRGIGFNRCYSLSTASFSWNAYEPKAETVKKLSKITERFYHDAASQKLYRPSTDVLIPYNLFRGMSIAYAPGSEYETEDGRHWTEPARKKRVYDEAVPVGVFQRPVGHLFYWIGKTAGKMKSMQVTYKK